MSRPRRSCRRFSGSRTTSRWSSSSRSVSGGLCARRAAPDAGRDSGAFRRKSAARGRPRAGHSVRRRHPHAQAQHELDRLRVRRVPVDSRAGAVLDPAARRGGDRQGAAHVSLHGRPCGDEHDRPGRPASACLGRLHARTAGGRSIVVTRHAGRIERAAGDHGPRPAASVHGRLQVPHRPGRPGRDHEAGLLQGLSAHGGVRA